MVPGIISSQTLQGSIGSGMQHLESLFIDSFAGGGGASTGILAATGRSPDYAINHCAHALHMHEANHPETHHLVENIWNVVPSDLVDGRLVDLAWFSPDCKHFSRAKGSKPVDSRVRGLAWTVVKWAKQTAPRRIFLENVPEFLEWGPVGKDGKPIKSRKGEIFRRWVRNLRELGYVVDWRTMDAADFGVPTHRTRLYLVARNDGEPITWPEPTHGPGLEPFAPASEIIDWTLPGRSIFCRKKPLVENTMFRIARGLKRYVMEAGDDAYIIRTGHYSNKTGKGRTLRGQRLKDPLGTVCASVNDKALIIPWIVQYYGGMTGKPMSVPLPTVTSTDHNALASVHVSRQVSERVDPAKVDEIRAFCIKYYGTSTGQSLNTSLHTITTKARMGLIEVHGKDYQIVDITLRMLEPHELAAAQGFPKDYVLTGTKANKIAKVGNSVCPKMAEVVVEANP